MQNYPKITHQDFVAAVEQNRLSDLPFDHCAHLRLASCYFLRWGYAAGEAKTQATIQAFAKANGADQKYHATLTQAYYRLTANYLHERGVTLEQLDEALLGKMELVINQAAVGQYYSEFLLQTEVARNWPVLPDREVLPSTAAGTSEESFRYFPGHLPILLSMPHNGTCIPNDIATTMTTQARQVRDTDWFLQVLYDFALKMGCHVITPLYSRYVIDLNRPETDESLYPGANVTELCPSTQFDLKPIYQHGGTVSKVEQQRRVERYWRPYHQALQQTLDALASQHEQVLLFEAHSIASVVPRFFSGQLSDFNFGTNDGASCTAAISDFLAQFSAEPYSQVCNGRFKGGYITRAYHDATRGISSVQLELSQRTYLDEKTARYDSKAAAAVQKVLQNLIVGLLETIQAK